jgi:hypothetical protein
VLDYTKDDFATLGQQRLPALLTQFLHDFWRHSCEKTCVV